MLPKHKLDDAAGDKNRLSQLVKLKVVDRRQVDVRSHTYGQEQKMAKVME